MTEQLTYVSPDDPRWKRLLIDVLERLSGRPHLARRYAQLQRTPLAPTEVWAEALRLLEVQVEVDTSPLARLPEQGPVVFVANHPFGVLDGLVLGWLAAQYRPDFSILVNAVLCRQDERLNAHLLPIDFGEDQAALRTNLHTRQEALRRLQAGEALVIFPSGGVATAPRGWGRARELPWKRFTAKLIQTARPTVVPIYFEGQNSRLFQLVSQVSQPLRLGLLLYEVRNKAGATLRVRIGEPIPYAELAHLRDRQALLDELYHYTHQLGQGAPGRRG